MTLEKIFHPNKWFVAFCALLIAVFASLQFVVNQRLEGIAKDYCSDIYTWDWPPAGMHSSVKVMDARVIKRGEADAIVEVHGEQTLKGKASDAVIAVTKCGARLSFWKQNNTWNLGKVELLD